MNIRTILKRIPHDDLLELVMRLIQSNKKAQEKALHFLENKGYLNDEELAQKHYNEYREKFAEAIDIISEFNMYGGGPEEDEDRAYENMEQVLSLLADGTLPDNCREEMIHELMEQYLEGNSGFDDAIWDWIERIACEEAHWRIVLSYLKQSNSKYNQSLMLDIYRYKLSDEETYEQMQIQQLTYGRDYLDYAQFLEQKGEKKKALEIAEKGLREGEGFLGALYEYVFERYEQMGEKEKALQLLKQQFQHRPSYELYKKAIAYAAPSVKEAVREELYELLTRQSFYSYVKAEIDYNEGNSKELLQYVTKTASFPIYSDPSKYERYLNEHHPLEMITYYKQKVEQLIGQRKRSAYRQAIVYIEEIRRVYIDILGQPDKWKAYFNSVIVPYQHRLPAFLDEWKKRGGE